MPHRTGTSVNGTRGARAAGGRGGRRTRRHAAPLEVLYPQAWVWSAATSTDALLNLHVATWLERRGLVPPERVQAFCAMLNLDAFVRFAFPACRAPSLRQWLARYTAWLYLADDELERAVAQHDGSSLPAIASYLAVLEHRRLPPSASPLARAFAALSDELLARVQDPCFVSKWREAHSHHWLLGALEEGRSTTQALQPCLVRKPAVTALHVYFDLIEVVTGHSLPEDLHDDEELSQLRALGALIDGLFNDALSFERERAGCVHSNVVLCLCSDRRMRTDQALRRTVELHNDLVMDFDVLTKALLYRHDAFATELSAYLQAMRYLLAGLAQWQLVVPRYRVPHALKLVQRRATPYDSVCSACLLDSATLAARIADRLTSRGSNLS